MNAEVNIDIGVHSTVRQYDEPFKPTKTYTADFHYVTDLDSYLDISHGIAVDTWNYVESERSNLAETFVHVAIRISNPTHPAVAAGVVTLPKAHLDFAITDINFSSITVLEDSINQGIKNLRTQVRY